MSAFYEEMAAVAEELLQEFGRDITVTRYGPGTSDLVTGKVERPTQLSQTLRAAVLPASQGTIQAFDVRFMDNVLASENLRFAVMSTVGSTFMPEPTDEAQFDGSTWAVLGCTPLNVDGTAVIYSVGFREV